MNKTEYVAALRELAAFVEGKDFPDRWTGYWGGNDSFPTPTLDFLVITKNDFGALARALGSFTKEASSSYTSVRKQLESGVMVSVSAPREKVCKKIVIGKRKLAAEPETIIPAKPEREEDVVEWECPESFVALKDEKELTQAN